MPTYHLTAACRLVTKSSRRECLSSDRNQRFEKVAAGAASHSVVDLSTHSSDDHACLSTTTSESTFLRLDPRTCRDQHWHWTNCTVTRRSKAPLDRSKHIPVLRASDGLEFLFSLDLRVNHDLTFLCFTRSRLTRLLALLPVFIVFF